MNGNSVSTIQLCIADIIIQIKSKFMRAPFSEEDESFRFNNFIYRGTKKPHIVLQLIIVDKLPRLHWARRLFITIHPDSNESNWGLYKRDGRYLLRTYIPDKKQHIVLNSTYNKGVVYVLPDKNGRFQWRLTDLIYDALQVILINYLAKRDGIFVHSSVLKDIDNKGIIFIGKSGAGKSTLARLWHKHSKATILNDDRAIIRKIKGNFFVYGSPWHGDFNDYLISKIDSAKPSNLLFIHHKRNNSLTPISKKEAFNSLYPNLFPVFWDKTGLIKTMGFCEDLLKNVPSYKLGFKRGKEIIKFVRRIARGGDK